MLFASFNAVRALSRRASLLVLPLALLALASQPQTARADEAQAATGTYDISVLLSSPEDQCFSPGNNRAIRDFVKRRVAELNSSHALNGRKLSVTFRDDFQNAQTSIENVRSAMRDPQTLALVGMPGWRRAADVFKQIGKEIGDSKIPFMSDISVNSIFKDQTNVFTMRASQEEERLPVIGRILKDQKFQRPAFIGVKDEENSNVLGEGLKSLRDTPPIVADHRLVVKDNKIDPAELTAAIADLKAKDVDMVIIALGGDSNAQTLREATNAGLGVPFFIFGNLENALKNSGLKEFPGDLYQLAFDGLPGLYNERLRQQILRNDTATWLFPDRKRTLSSGWLTGKCKEPDGGENENVLDPANLRAISRGTQYADMIGLIASLIKEAPANEGVNSLRQRVVEGIGTAYATGLGMYQGEYDNWSFRPDSRTASRTPVIIIRPRGTQSVRLAPDQYVRVRNDSLRRIQTLYMDIDLIRLHRVDDKEKSFFADFYLSVINSDKLSIANIDFANAYIDPENNGPQFTVTPLHEGGQSDAYPEGSKIYKVSGKFNFKPDFSRFPFDTQLFSIDVQRKSGDLPFVIQPPSRDLRDKVADTEGWAIADQYVGYDEDFISVIDTRGDTKSVVPFYKGSYSWIMTREATDYYLQVVIPLAFILIVAYLSIFIPKENFEAIVTIQVTALLSAVALYLSIPKVASDTATVSDRIFLVDYLAVSLMIGLSILRVSEYIKNRPKYARAIDIVHILGIPILVGVLVVYILGQSPAQTMSTARFM
ncbi:MAG: ABC transporter substrate-binding protein [Hyphomicrobiaceae bacterium]|nr:ABC transporter substrate-binding protein [Hyphomicrobiaceae bacterium]